jgi:hypothetical protein
MIALSKNGHEEVIVLMCGDSSWREVALNMRIVQHIISELSLHGITKQTVPFSWTGKKFARLCRREWYTY